MLLLWQAQVGDIIRLSSGDAIPADLLLLYTSDPSGVAFVDTSNLDGETNLKPRSIFYERETEGAPPPFDPKQFVNPVQCDQPNVKIYSFNGFVEHDHHRVVLSAENLLLRDCVLRNTDEVYGHPFAGSFWLCVHHVTARLLPLRGRSPLYRYGVVVYAGHETKAMLNNTGPRHKVSCDHFFICFLRGRVLIRCDGCRSHQCSAPRRAFSFFLFFSFLSSFLFVPPTQVTKLENRMNRAVIYSVSLLFVMSLIGAIASYVDQTQFDLTRVVFEIWGFQVRWLGRM